jgi:hypothetical protein
MLPEPATPSECRIRLEFRFIRYDLSQAAEVGGWGVESVTTVTDRILFGAAKSQLQHRQPFVN